VIGATAVAIILRRERDVVDAFRRARATDPRSARTLDDLTISETNAVSRLRRSAVLREVEPGLFYLDEPSWEALRGMRRRAVLVVVGVVLLMLLVMVVSGVARR